MKINFLNSNCLLSVAMSISLISSINLGAQTSDQLNDLKEMLGKQTAGGGSIESEAMRPEDSGYKSFVQNEMQNIFSSLDALSDQDKADITFAEVNKKRIELATSLCARDQRACFLIDEYRSYQSYKDFPLAFDELELFGMNVFSGYANDFNFYDSLPISNDYVIKIGDKFKISLFGGFSFEQVLVVNPNGSIIITDIGEFQIAGLSYQDASNKIRNEIENKFVGTEAYISIDQIRSKQVFALGNVKSPGTYALNAFGSALNALISSGGIKQNSSLRTLKVLRGNEIIKTLDLYDLLIDGDTKSSDFQLSDGDSILVGGLTSSASIIGEVIRPAIYEISPEDTLQELIRFALGATPFADLSNISVERILPSGQKTIIKPIDRSRFLLKDGDQVVINISQGEKINAIELLGAIRNSGEYSLQSSNTLGDIINIQTDLQESTYTGFAILKRLDLVSKTYRILNFSLTNQDALNKINLYSGDKIFVFSKEDIAYSQSKEVYSYLDNKLNKKNTSNTSSQVILSANLSMGNDVINSNSNDSLETPDTFGCLNSLDVLTANPISNLMRAKLKVFSASKSMACSTIFHKHNDLLPLILINAIPVAGNVRFPGLYPTSRDLNALDLFNLAGGFLQSKLNTAPVFDVGIRARDFGSFAYEDLNTLSNITMLSLKLDQSSFEGGYIKLVGEFVNPGIYSINKNSKLSEIYERAGGLTSSAYPVGGILTRESVQKTESKALERSKAELAEILASAAASGYLKQNTTDLVGLISLMTNMDNAQPIGRFVTELNPSLLETSPSLNIILDDGDIIYMPKLQNTITIVGQVLNPVTVPHKAGSSFEDYLKLAGGMKKEADKSKVYAILPNGISIRRSRGIKLPLLPNMPFNRSDILPGSTIIIPRKARPLDGLTLVETVTPVLANLSVTAASIAAISDR
jgi:protein involved in polysaccharide export with SLBB domain